MKNKIAKMLFVGATIFFFVIVNGCDSGGGATKYLAKNIIFDTENTKVAVAQSNNKNRLFNLDFLSKAYAQSDTVDTETKIMAQNVVFENESYSHIESDNVQDALEEITLKLKDVLPGTWTIENYNYEEEYYLGFGKIIFYDDGSFNLIEGSFAALSVNSETANVPYCHIFEQGHTYQFFTDDLVMFNFLHATFNGDTVSSSRIPRLEKLRQNEIIFTGSSSCGTVGRTRISILARVIDEE